MLWRLLVAGAAHAPALSLATQRAAAVCTSNPAECARLSELITQRRVTTAVGELEVLLDSGVSLPPTLVSRLLRCAGSAGDLRGLRKAHRLWRAAVEADAEGGAGASDRRLVEEAHALALASAGDVTNGALTLQRLASDDGDVRITTLRDACRLVTSVCRELRPSSRPLRRPLRQMGGAKQIGGCLCCQPTAAGAQARAEAAWTVAWLVAQSGAEAEGEADGEAATARAEAGAMVAGMLEAAGATPRFEVGATVEVRAAAGGEGEARVEAAGPMAGGGAKARWRLATVVQHMWREATWGWEEPVAPYRLKLEGTSGSAAAALAYCASDTDAAIREPKLLLGAQAPRRHLDGGRPLRRGGL